MKFGYFSGEPNKSRILLINYNLKTLNFSQFLSNFSAKGKEKII